MSLPRFTISDWSAGKYGSEKSTIFSRSGVIVRGRGDHVEPSLGEVAEDRVERRLHELGLEVEPLRDLVHDVHVEALVVGRAAELERRVGDVGADPQLCPR